MRPEIYKASAVVGSTIDLRVNWELSDCFIGIKYYDADPSGDNENEVVPGAGTVTVTAKLATHERYVAVTDGVFDCTDVDAFASYIGNATDIRCVPSGITTATWYEVIVSQNAVSGFNILDPLGSGANTPAVSGVMSSSELVGSDGEKQTWTLTENSVLSFSLSDGQGVLLRIVSGGYTVDFSAVDLWIGGVAPASIESDSFFIFWNDGGEVIGQEVGAV